MDAIQKTLIKAGRKDLAKKYYKKITGLRKPMKSDIDKIIKAYALKKYSAKENAPVKTQQKFYDNYNKVLKTLSAKYQDFDMSSNVFENQIEKLADKLWSKKAMRGAGVDW